MLAAIKGKGSPLLETSVGFRSLSRFSAVSPQVTEAINLAVDCHYFPPGPRLLPQPPSITALLAGTKLYYLVTRICKQLAQGSTRQRRGRDSNPRPVDRKSSSVTTAITPGPFVRHVFAA